MSKIIELAKKLKALADRGVDGEKDNAEMKLRALMEKHNLTEADLESEQVKIHPFLIESDKHKQNKDIRVLLAYQLAGLYEYNLYGEWTGKDRKYIEKMEGIKCNYGIKCTDYQFIEFKMKFDFYCGVLVKEFEAFIYAFCLKHDFLIKRKDDSKSSESDIEKYLKAKKIADTMEDAKFQKQIENK